MSSNSIIYSYSSASGIYPMKLFMNRKVLDIIISKNLKPVSVNVNLTNRCNLNCSFCSCSDRDKKIEIEYNYLIKFFEHYKDSIQSVIITGGGEPLLYDKFDLFVKYLFDNNIKVGLVTNGLLLERTNVLDMIKWTRVSLSEKSYDNGLFEVVKNIISRNYKTKWAFSYVACTDIEKNTLTLKKYIDEFYDKITHIRIVNDLHVLDDRVKTLQDVFFVPEDKSEKIIFQERKNHTRGTSQCGIACLKPNIAATGDVMPCCGVQYAKKDAGKKDYLEEFSMGNIKNPNNIFDRYFDGSICDTCYYMHYNNAIKHIQEKIDDLEFI